MNKRTRLYELTKNNLKLIADIKVTCGKYHFPRLKRAKLIPVKLTAFNCIKNDQERKLKTIHFFLDDYMIERFWTYPYRYLRVFEQYRNIIGADFSMFTNPTAKALNLYNCWRNRCLDYFLQQNGIDVIPTVVWGSPDTFDYCFDGIPKHSIIAIGSVGTSKSKDLFLYGFTKMVEILKPHTIIYVGPFYKELEPYQKLIVPFDTSTKTNITNWQKYKKVVE